MEESFENKLLKVDLLEIYDDIAAIELSKDQIHQLCSTSNCRVDLTIGNVVYAVEKKFKHKLANYKQSKRLKWLNVNLETIIPNPEEKLIKWQQRHMRNKKINWIKRKLYALDNFISDSLVYQSEEPCCSHTVERTERQLAQRVQHVSRYFQCGMHETSNSTTGNTSAESVQTVIASQPRNTLESVHDVSPLLNFRNVSRSTISSSSGELPSLIQDGDSEAQTVQSSDNIIIRVATPQKQNKKRLLPLLQLSEGLSSQEEAYVTFYQDMQVTSTQEFGWM